MGWVESIWQDNFTCDKNAHAYLITAVPDQNFDFCNDDMNSDMRVHVVTDEEQIFEKFTILYDEFRRYILELTKIRKLHNLYPIICYNTFGHKFVNIKSHTNRRAPKTSH